MHQKKVRYLADYVIGFKKLFKKTIMYIFTFQVTAQDDLASCLTWKYLTPFQALGSSILQQDSTTVQGPTHTNQDVRPGYVKGLFPCSHVQPSTNHAAYHCP